MSLTLQEVRFNHDPTSSSNSALNIRKNASQLVPVPEWRAGMSSSADSCAAYAISEVDEDSLTIGVALASDELRSRSVEIRAVIGDRPPIPAWWLQQLDPLRVLAPLAYVQARAYLEVLWANLWQSQSKVLGSAGPISVALDEDGRSGRVQVPLVAPGMWDLGVGAWEVVWDWQWRSTGTTSWSPVTTTRHRIYSVVQTPTAPWLQLPYTAANTQLPWADVLQYACVWAAGARTPRAASARITREVFGLGDGLLRYGCQVGAVTVYSEGLFNCTAFLERLQGGFGRGPFVNCSDTATIVSTFANVLGTDLWQSQMRNWHQPFPVNAVKAIGFNHWEPPCGIGLFDYHEVAWDGAASTTDSVYDACLEVQVTPPFPPYVGVLPVDMRFGAVGDGAYRDRLASFWGRHLCQAQPLTRTRRLVI